MQAIKLLFDLPAHIPTPALIFSLGLIYTSLRVKQKQLLYLWKLVNREQGHWTKQALAETLNRNIGWGKHIQATLSKFDLPTNLDTIKAHRKNEWTQKVKSTIEKQNTERLLKDCHRIENGEQKRKTKTAFIVDHIKEPGYVRGPTKELLKCTKREAKALLIARFGMLECGKNFKGTHSTNCTECGVYDDEEHRLNYCTRYKVSNYFNSSSKIDFNLIYSNDVRDIRDVIEKISTVWNFKTANGSMNIE